MYFPVLRLRGLRCLRAVIEKLIQYIVYYCDWVAEVTPDEIDKAIQKVIEGKEGIRMAQTIRKGISDIAWEGGFAEGEVRGEARGRAGSIVRFLGRRFQKVPKSIKDKVCSITDINRLDELTDQAADCQSLAEFSKSLQSQR